jgi:hypothetical protein
MSRRTQSVLLTLSVALNASFLAGFLYVGRELRGLRTREGRAEWAARSLGLDEAQRDAFLREHAAWRAELDRMAQSRKAESDAFWREAVRDGADPAAVRARLEPLLDVQRQATVSGVDHLLRLFRGLTPAQRESLADMVRRRGEP